MQIVYRAEKKDFREGGVHFLTVRFCRATLLGEEAYRSALSDFLWGWQTDVLAACERALLPQLRQAYLDDPSPRKRFVHRPCVVTCSVSHEETLRRRYGVCLLFTRRVELSAQGENVTLLHERDCVECTHGFFLS